MEQRGENVASYCETSLLHEYKLDGLALKAVSGKEPDVTVAPCGGGRVRGIEAGNLQSYTLTWVSFYLPGST